MKRFVISLAVGMVGILLMSGNAQAVQFKSCGATPVFEQPDNYVWVARGGCDRAITTVRSFYRRWAEFLEMGSITVSMGKFECIREDRSPEFSKLECEGHPLVLGLENPATDPNEWENPPDFSRTLTRKQAERLVADFRDDFPPVTLEKYKVSCPKRVSRLSFDCRASWFQDEYFVRERIRVTRFHGGSAGTRTRVYDRNCLKAGGTLKKCEYGDESEL